MLLSIFTPTHDLTHIITAYKSLTRQIGDIEWEWIIVPNGTVTPVDFTEEMRNDTRIKIIPAPEWMNGRIGALKGFACGKCFGDMFIELDHDDTLTSDALSSLADAYDKVPNGFYFSDFVSIKKNGKCETYNINCGWEHYKCTIDGNEYIASHGFEPSARSLCQIYYAPNHVRAWSSTAYDKAGGHSQDLHVADDHDLICRTYLKGTPFVWIKKPLYIYRRWENNSFIVHNKDVQKLQTFNCEKYLDKLIEEECRRKGLKMIDVGQEDFCKKDRYESFDIHKKSKDIGYNGLCHNYEDSSIGLIRAEDTLQKIPQADIVTMMADFYNALVPGGWIITATPAINDANGVPGRSASVDPTHVSYWAENNFWYFTDKKYAKMLTHFAGKYQAVNLATKYPSDWHRANRVPYVEACLCALKGQRQPGLCKI